MFAMINPQCHVVDQNEAYADVSTFHGRHGHNIYTSLNQEAANSWREYSGYKCDVNSSFQDGDDIGVGEVSEMEEKGRRGLGEVSTTCIHWVVAPIQESHPQHLPETSYVYSYDLITIAREKKQILPSMSI